MGSSFDEWLRALPTPQQLAPASPYLTGRKGETGIGPNIVPALWQAFAPQGKALIDQQAIQRFRGGAAGASTARRDLERNLLSSYQSLGVDPLIARAQLGESQGDLGAELARMRGETEAEKTGNTFDLQSGLLNAIIQSYLGERELNVNAFLASKGRQAARSGAQSAATASMVGAGLGALGSILGGPIGGELV